MAKKTATSAQATENKISETERAKPAKPAKQGMAKYKVTARAGGWVAGRRSPGAGEEIQLTPQQADTPLRNGEIEAA